MTKTKGGLIIEDIKRSDIHYEFAYGTGIEVEVLTIPVRDDRGYWSWQSKNVRTGEIINYGVSEDAAHYGPNLYDYIAYHVSDWI